MTADGHGAHRPRPRPVTGPAPRPRWSVMIPTYHCADVLATTLRSVLDQDPGEDVMQVEVVDDHSTDDDPEAVVRAVAPGRVGFFRQPANVGHTRNFNTCLDRARGHLVHLLHGDDAVLPGFYARMGAALEAHPEVGAAFCRHVVMDEEGTWLTLAPLVAGRSGVLDGWFDRIATGQLLQAPAMVVRREVYEEVGGFDQRIPSYGEDWEMWTRIAAHRPVWYETATLACYRVHTRSLSGRTLRTGQNMRDIRLVIDLNRDLMPADRAAELTRRSRENNALGAVRRALRLYDGGDVEGATAQVREALATSRSPRVAAQVAALVPRVSWRAARRAARRASGG
ncbi:MAG TPA: glycosyltransferase family A protein [Acidimicrobiales bacterium]